MGLFGSTPASLPPPKIAKDGAPIAPDRSQRSKCWEARDNFFDCLDKNGIIDSLTEKDKAEKGCKVAYFKQRRVMEHKKAQTLAKLKAEGAVQMPGEIGPGGAPGQRP